jgi:hypothetical protein
MSERFESLRGLWGMAWDVLDDGVKYATSAARFVNFATLDLDSWPEARTVAIRRSDRALGIVETHTDLTSNKITSLRTTPRVAMTHWDTTLDLQIRLWAEVSIMSGKAVTDIWAKVPPNARVSYGEIPSPGTPIPSALAYVKEPTSGDFAVLRCTVTKMDIVHLGANHRRAAYLRTDDWAGTWLAP